MQFAVAGALDIRQRLESPSNGCKKMLHKRRTCVMTPGKTIRIVIALGLLSCAARNASAQTNYYWDPANTISSNGSGSGTWDTGTSGNWWVSGSTDSQWTDTAGTAAAVFGGTAGTYTVNVS